MPGHSRPRNRKHTLNRRCIGMANPAGLDAYADIAGLRIDKGLAGQFKFAGADGLNGSVGHFGFRHFSLLCWTNDASRTSAPTTIGTTSLFGYRARAETPPEHRP